MVRLEAVPRILTKAAQSMAANQKDHRHRRRLQGMPHHTSLVAHPILANPHTRHPPPPHMGLPANPHPNQDTVRPASRHLVTILADHHLTSTSKLTETRSLTQSPVHLIEHHQVTLIPARVHPLTLCTASRPPPAITSLAKTN